MFTVESKSQLAKLLASENLIVEHKTIPTAYFNLKTRTLSCPIWKDMSGDLYDLLMGHEVGHALYTPEEGWHDAICSEGKNFKSFLNVIEDTRIEKKIKRKYPGIKRSFVNAYQDLLEKDFFGIKKRDLTIIPFIDKVNLFTKTDGIVNFEFSNVEQSMLDRVLLCETWQDVVNCAKEIFEYSKEEQKSILEDYFQSPSFDDLSDDMEPDSFEEAEYESESADEETVNSKETESENTEETDDETESYDRNFDSGSTDDYEQDFEPACETDEFYRNNEVKLLDDSSKEYYYVNVPKPIYKNIFTPYEIVHGHLTRTFDCFFTKENINHVYREFRNKNEKYISLMAKEFEMKKAAKAYLKNKTSDTGDIDINKIFKYKFDDNIFKKVTIQPKGKSHGLILLLDHSGSMYNNMGASIEQILILSLFCKKVNIPFTVYAFVDFRNVRRSDYPSAEYGSSFERSENNLSLDDMYLREYLNSKMNTNEFNRCIRNLTMLANQFNVKHGKIPVSESFGGTPLIQAMIALKNITKKFKSDNNLDIVNTVIVHDGDADTVNSFYSEDKRKSFSTHQHNVVINDREQKIQIKLENDPHPFYNYDYALKNAIFEWYRKSTGSKIFGFFIVGIGSVAKRNICTNYRDSAGQNLSHDEQYNRYRRNYNEVKLAEVMKNFKENKFIQSYNKGYDAFYLIPGGKDLSVENEELQVTGNITKSKLKTAFMKMGKKKQTNRILVNKFIAGIA